MMTMTYMKTISPRARLSPRPTMPDFADYMTTEEAAELLGLHVETIRLFLRYKRFTGKKWGRTWLVSRQSVTDYQKENADKEKHDPRRNTKKK